MQTEMKSPGKLPGLFKLREDRISFADPNVGCSNQKSPLASLDLLSCFSAFANKFASLQNRKAPAGARAFLICREDRIRTCDPVVPNHVFYRAELPPESGRDAFLRLYTYP
jgi:hypothetical protein